VLDTPEGEVTVEPVGLARTVPGMAPTAWLVGGDRRVMALALPGGGHVIAVRREGGRRSR